MRGRGPSWGVALVVVFLLALFAFRLTDSANRNALTFDEPHYVGAGLYLWDSGDYDFARSLYYHPPLAYHLASLPLLFVETPESPLLRDVGHRMLSGSEPSPDRVRVLSRLPFILLACWGAFLIYLWARDSAGVGAGLFALALVTASPIFLAHSFLAHSDITVTVFFIQTLYTFWRWSERRTFLRFSLCGLSLGLALIAKLSALLLLPILALLLWSRETGFWPFVPKTEAEDSSAPASKGFVRSSFRAAGLLVDLLLVALLVLWVGYGFSFSFQELTQGTFEGVSIPAYLHSFFFDVAANAQNRSIYFFGEVGSGEQFWYLLPVAWFLKTPIPFLILAAWAVFFRSSSSGPESRRLSGFLLVPMVVYLGVAMFVLQVPLGVRYLLPILPLFDLFVATRLAPFQGRRAVAAGVLLVWFVAVGAWIHPHYLSFFNPWVGGPTDAHQALVESNYDWGQALPSLAEELEARGRPPLWLAYFGGEPPERYGIESRRLPSCEPVTGTVAISATLLRGLYSLNNPFRAAPEGCFDWLLEYEPVAQPGYAILLYEIPETP